MFGEGYPHVKLAYLYIWLQAIRSSSNVAFQYAGLVTWSLGGGIAQLIPRQNGLGNWLGQGTGVGREMEGQPAQQC